MLSYLRAAGIVALLAAGLAGTAMAQEDTTLPAAGASGVIDAFMNGKLEQLEPALANLKDGGLTAAEKTDIAYVRQCLMEGRPAWWKQAKAGRTFNFKPVVWGRPLTAAFDPTAKSNLQVNSSGAKPAVTFMWNVADMDKPDQAEHGFTVGELTDLGVWMYLGDGDTWAIVPPPLVNLNADPGKTQFQRYLDFRASLTGIHYGMPRSRRWGLWLCFASYMQSHAEEPTVNSRRAIAAAFLCEVLSKPEKYPSLHLPSDAQADEESLSLYLKDKLEKKGWTIAEDKLIRDAMRALAAGNELASFKASTVALPNGTFVALVPEKDKPLRDKREAWLKAQLAKRPRSTMGE